MRRTLVIADENGQLGNKLFLFAHYAAFAIEINGSLFFPSFNSVSDYFICVSENNYGEYHISSRFSKNSFFHSAAYKVLHVITGTMYRALPVSFFHRIIRIYKTYDARVLDYNFYNLENEPDVFRKQKLLILQGWNFRAANALARQKKNIIPLLKLKNEWQNKINDFINVPRKRYEILIGVHVRRGDYRNYCDGKFFYDDEVYLNFMRQTAALFPGKKIGFIICSNEQITINNRDEFSIINGPGHFLLDLFTLSECDYIIGPPSTYSQWASFYSDKPLRILLDKEAPIESLQEFEVSKL